MKIAESQIQLSGYGVHRYQQTRRESLSAWNGTQRLTFNSASAVSSASAVFSADRASVSDMARQLAGEQAKSLAAAVQDAQPNVSLQNLLATAPAAKKSTADDEELDPISQLKVLLVEALTGHKVLLFSPGKFAHDREQAADAAAQTADKLGGGKQQAANAEPQPLGWGVSYQYHEETRETEQASFQAKGVVKTADGKQIAFSAGVEMSRERVTVTDFQLRAGDALTDPLVLNFGGTSAELTDRKINFDLNSDGRNERMSFVRSGSGFLVYDRNGDGKVNNGLELFGPKTGSGFRELATLDDDKNGWLDENDAAYSKLSIWTQDEQGADQLSTLQDKNVGAIYLQSAATPYNLDNTEGDMAGKLRATGVYLTEDGQARTVQQVDLVT